VGYLAGPPLHIHPDQSEIHYLIHGKLRYQIGEGTIDLDSGEYIQIPKNTPHAWINLQSESARLIGVLTPGGGSEGFFKAVAEKPLAPEALMKLAQDYGTEVVRTPLAIAPPLSTIKFCSRSPKTTSLNSET
jgi:oxalate decarboxylase/phosphoglucose isomerase-like protein (cupin superfamily)